MGCARTALVLAACSKTYWWGQPLIDCALLGALDARMRCHMYKRAQAQSHKQHQSSRSDCLQLPDEFTTRPDHEPVAQGLQLPRAAIRSAPKAACRTLWVKLFNFK
jgi:hypothetical protein